MPVTKCTSAALYPGRPPSAWARAAGTMSASAPIPTVQALVMMRPDPLLTKSANRPVEERDGVGKERKHGGEREAIAKHRRPDHVVPIARPALDVQLRSSPSAVAQVSQHGVRHNGHKAQGDARRSAGRQQG